MKSVACCQLTSRKEGLALPLDIGMLIADMALDLAILGSDGAPEVVVALSDEEHFSIMKPATHLSLVQLVRMKDYYADVDYTTLEVEHLVKELKLVTPHILDEKMKPTLSALQALFTQAVSRQVGISVIAD